MTRDEAVTEIQRGLGYRSDQTDNIILALQEAQRHFEQGLDQPWFLREEDASIAVSDGVRTTSLPADFNREVDCEGPHYTTSDGGVLYLVKDTFGFLNSLYASSDASGPKAYTLRNDNFYWFPEPDDDYTLYHTYYKADTVLDSNVENLWLEHTPHLLIGRAGALIAADLQNDKAVQRFTEQLREAQNDFIADLVEREAENHTYRMGGG